MNLDKNINIVNQSKINFYFLVVDNSLSIDPYFLKNFYLIFANHPNQTYKSKSFCLHQKSIKNSGQLLSQTPIVDYIKTTSSKNKHQVAIVSFKPSAKIKYLCQQHRWLYVANSTQLSRRLENKFKFLKLCQKNNLPTIPAFLDKFNQQNFQRYQQQFKQKRLVLQTSFGWAGQSTFSASAYSQLKNKIQPQRSIKFSPLLHGYTLLNNAVIYHQKLIQSPPALQISRLKKFSSNPFATIGRQWPSLAPSSITKQIKKITIQFSKILINQNYQGFFGLDFFVDTKNNVYLLEINPRLTASFAFYTQLEIKQKLTPLFLFHLAQLSKIKLKKSLLHQQKLFKAKMIGHQLTHRRLNGHIYKKIEKFSIFKNKI
ncbi:hypothetical protein DRH14_01530 [Candidatus Shapirobacteria bacterium]|nr:MAG: hypothetical protein DRH14_01530 [Candidatus Shapirobacteria bacterium]